MTSAVAGYLQPAPTPAPLEDDALADFLGDVVTGITGLDRGELVRPRWQEDPPNIPDRAVTWCAIGVVDHMADATSSVQEASDGTSQTFIRHETLVIRASFYGPASGAMASLFRDGLQIPQNHEQLMTAGFGFIDAGGPTAAPELIKQKWLDRNDIVWRTRREVRRFYPVLSLLSAHGTVATQSLTVQFDTTLLMGG